MLSIILIQSVINPQRHDLIQRLPSLRAASSSARPFRASIRQDLHLFISTHQEMLRHKNFSDARMKIPASTASEAPGEQQQVHGIGVDVTAALTTAGSPALLTLIQA